MSNLGPLGTTVTPGLPTPPQGETIGRYATYLQAQRAVDFLSDSHFPVQHVTIVGTGLQMVERVTGRLTYPKVAVSGLASGAWFGAFVALAVALFGGGTTRSFIAVMGIGAGFGLLYGVMAYSMTGGRRDFTSTSQIVATEYVVLCEVQFVGEARRVLQALPGGAPTGPWGAPAPVDPYGEPPRAGEPRFDGPAPGAPEGAPAAPGTETVTEPAAPAAPVEPGLTYGEVMARRRAEERAREAAAEERAKDPGTEA